MNRKINPLMGEAGPGLRRFVCSTACLLAFLATSVGAWAQKKEEAPLIDLNGKVVSIKGNAVSGLGAVVSKGGKTYIVTTTRVLGGNKTLAITTDDGKALKPTSIALAPNSELVFIETEGMEGVPVVEAFEAEINQKDDFVVVAGKGTNGKLLELTGRLEDIGEQWCGCYFSGDFRPEHNGGLVVHRRTRKLIGIAGSFEMANIDSLERASRVAAPQRVVYRVDNVGELTPTKWPTFLKEAATLSAMRQRTLHLLEATVEIFRNPYRVDPKREASQRYKCADASIQRCLDDHAAGYRENASPEVVRQNLAKFHRSILWAATADLKNANPANFTGFNRKLLEDEIAARKQIEAWIETKAEN